MKRRFHLRCPDCGSKIVVGPETGSVLEHRAVAREPNPRADFDSLLADLDDDRARAEERFDQELAAHQNRDRLLEEKFERARRRAEKEGDLDRRPERPWDFD